LHYKKDVTFKEDESKFIAGNAAVNKSLLINWAINVFHKNNLKNTAKAIRMFSHRPYKLFSMLLE